MKYRIMVTGHRPNKLDGYANLNGPVSGWVFETLHRWLRENSDHIEYAITGMAQGVDQLWANACRMADVPYVAMIPFVGQEARWPAGARRRYTDILHRALRVDVVVTPPPRTDAAARDALLLRNTAMVREAHHGIAVWDTSRGGTSHAVGLLRAADKLLWHIDPRDCPDAEIPF